MGPGTELHSLLNSFGISFTETCNCSEHVKTMDAWGPSKCRQNWKIIIGWLKDEALVRKLPFNYAAAKVLILLAIYKSELKIKNSKDST